MEEAGAGVPHGTVRATTAGAIRGGGGSVSVAPERTRAGAMNLQHVNAVVLKLFEKKMFETRLRVAQARV